MKLPRLITRRRVKWVGTPLTLALLAVFVTSAWYQVVLSHETRDGITSVGIDSGTVFLSSMTYGRPVRRDYPRLRGLTMSARRKVPGLTWLPTWRIEDYGRTGLGPSALANVMIPLWPLLLVVAIITAWFWYTDRRAKPWQCANCRYDLRGLDGVRNGGNRVCPECGTPTERTA